MISGYGDQVDRYIGKSFNNGVFYELPQDLISLKKTLFFSLIWRVGREGASEQEATKNAKPFAFKLTGNGLTQLVGI